MKLSKLPEFKAQQMAQEEIKKEDDSIQLLLEIQKDLKIIKTIVHNLEKQNKK